MIANENTVASADSGVVATAAVDSFYPRARLWLGITSVGSIVMVCALGVMFEADLWFDKIAIGPRYGELEALGWFVAFFILLGLPFDLIGGRFLPLAHGRPVPPLSVFTLALTRGVLIHGVMLFASAVGFMHSLRIGGWPAAIAFFSVGMLLLAATQRFWAKLIGGLREEEDRSPALKRTSGTMASIEDGYAGGITGIPGLERIDLPARWRQEWPAAQIQLALERRRFAVRSGLYLKGLAMAFAWNLAGSAVAGLIIGIPEGRVGEVVEFSFLITLWNFLGLLILPTASRNAVIAMDREMIRQGHAPDALAWLAADCARLQDGEISRNERVETFFHPIPSLEQRWIGLETPANPFAGWNVSRQMLYLSWPLLGMVSRAVHGSVGRPALWVMPPAD